jgi:hypothetical protein
MSGLHSSVLRRCNTAAGVLAGLVFGAASCTAASAGDTGVPVDIELVMGVDISYSMDRYEQQLQRAGYVKALTSPEFLNALKSNTLGKIAIAYMQWASYSDQDILLDWTLIDGPETARAASEKLQEAPYRRAQRTSISGAIDAASKLFASSGFKGARQVIDISGDGPNNNGRVVTAARDEALARGITINGLPLVGIREYIGPADIKDLDVYYQDCVIGGPDAFMIAIHNVKDFVEATRNKLVREIASVNGPKPKAVRVAATEPRISCTIGESLWRGRWGN